MYLKLKCKLLYFKTIKPSKGSGGAFVRRGTFLFVISNIFLYFRIIKRHTSVHSEGGLHYVGMTSKV